MPDPRIPDSAFDHAHARIGTLLDMGESRSPDQDEQAATSFYRALGLEGAGDPRVMTLILMWLGRLRGDVETVSDDDVRLAEFGVMLGLLLAQGTDWEAPITGKVE